jgi:hypothetical protein
MDEQARLFDPHRSPWVERLWREAKPRVRRKLIALLAEMGRVNLRRMAARREVRRES